MLQTIQKDMSNTSECESEGRLKYLGQMDFLKGQKVSGDYPTVCFNKDCPNSDNNSISRCRVHCTHFVSLCNNFSDGFKMSEINIEIYPGEQSQEFQSGNFLNAIDQIVSWYKNNDQYYLEDEDIVDSLRLYAELYNRNNVRG